MCDPLTIAFIAVSAAGTLYSTDQARKNADAASDYQNAVYKRNAELADDAALAAYSSLQRRQLEEREAAGQGIEQVKRQALQAAGAARVSAGEAGVGGLNIDALLGDFARQELEYQTSVIRNQAFRSAQFGQEYEAIRGQQAGRILSALPQPVAKPDFFGAALRIGADALGGYTSNTHYDPNIGGRAWNSTGKKAIF